MKSLLLFFLLLPVSSWCQSEPDEKDEHWFNSKITEIESNLPEYLYYRTYGVNEDAIVIENKTDESLFALSEKSALEISILKVADTPFSKIERYEKSKICKPQTPIWIFSAWEWAAWDCERPRFGAYVFLNAVTNPQYSENMTGPQDKTKALPEDYWIERKFLYSGQIYYLKFKVHSEWNDHYGKFYGE